MLTIYKASAGSGKTYKLAYEYIRMALGVKRETPIDSHGKKKYYRLNMSKYGKVMPNLHRHILAITFTNKATEEMKRRIIENLYDLACPPTADFRDADYADALIDEFECTRDELASVAMSTMERMLYDYQSIGVSTIDSFFQRVLRSFARELDQQGDFEIELDDDTVMQNAVGILLDDFNSGRSNNDALHEWLLSFMEKKMEDGRKNNFFNRSSRAHTSLVGEVSSIKKEAFKTYWDDMRAYLLNPEKPLDKFRSKIQRLKDEAAETLKTRALTIVEELSMTEHYQDYYIDVVESVMLMSKGNANDTSRLRKDHVLKFINGSSYAQDVVKSKSLKKVALTAAQESDLRQLLADAYFCHITLDRLLDCLHTLNLLAFVWPYYQDYAGDNNLVMLSSTNDLLRRIIGHDDAPFIYERVGVQLRNFLIDEFQDTSRLQWRNLYSLVDNGLSQNNDSLIIGDVKQSIYRFRNSDPSLLRKEVAAAFSHQHVEQMGDKASQNTNYRSSIDVVTFNNSLFSVLPFLGKIPVPGYDNVVQAVDKTTLRGYVRFEPFDYHDSNEEMLESMCQHIIRQNRAGVPWKEIAILINKNTDGGMAVDYIMSHHGDEIPVTSGESLYLKKSSAVQLVIGMLRIIDQLQSAQKPIVSPDKPFPSFADVTLMLSRYEYFYAQLQDASLALKYAIYPDQAKGLTLPQALDNGIKDVIERCPSSLLSLVDTIISQHLTDEQRKGQLSYLLALQDTVAEYSNRFTPSVHAFLQWWDKNNLLTVMSAADTDAVKVMTIHKAKGLEFKCVHIPFASWPSTQAEIKGKPNYQWVATPPFAAIPAELLPPALLVNLANKDVKSDPYFAKIVNQENEMVRADIMNKTYVAYTRAVSELIVYYDPESNMGKLLVDALSKGKPEVDEESAPWVVDLKRNFDEQTKIFEMGIPYNEQTDEQRGVDATDKLHKRPAPGSARMPLTIDYSAVIRKDAAVVTTLDSATKQAPQLEEDQAKADSRYLKDDFIDEAARIRGNQLHEILSAIVLLEDLDDALAAVVRRYNLGQQKEQEHRKVIAAALSQDHELVKRWFSPEVRVANEQPIYLPTVRQHRFIDRLVAYDDGSVDIIDYKFTTQVREEHLKQIAGYVGLVSQMGRYTRVRGYLWYPELQIITNYD